MSFPCLKSFLTQNKMCTPPSLKLPGMAQGPLPLPSLSGSHKASFSPLGALCSTQPRARPSALSTSGGS